MKKPNNSAIKRVKRVVVREILASDNGRKREVQYLREFTKSAWKVDWKFVFFEGADEGSVPVVLVGNDVELCSKRDQILLTLGFTSEVINRTSESCGNARDDRRRLFMMQRFLITRWWMWISRWNVIIQWELSLNSAVKCEGFSWCSLVFKALLEAFSSSLTSGEWVNVAMFLKYFWQYYLMALFLLTLWRGNVAYKVVLNISSVL